MAPEHHSSHALPTHTYRYGVKRLVQIKLQELMLTIQEYMEADFRVSFFARACGLFDIVNEETFNHYIRCLSLVMVDLLSVRSRGVPFTLIVQQS